MNLKVNRVEVLLLLDRIETDMKEAVDLGLEEKILHELVDAAYND